MEVVVAIGIVILLLAILLPTMSSARTVSHQQQCAECLRRLAVVWDTCLAENGDQFPYLAVQPGWHYGGVRFSSATGDPFLDFRRPLNHYLLRAPGIGPDDRELLFLCPADAGIADAAGDVGTAGRTAFRSFGTSFRMNAALVNAQIARVGDEARGLSRSEITAAPSRLLLMGDPVWYEVSRDTGRLADWHGRPRRGNFLLLDGSVRFQEIRARTANQPVVFDPLYGWGRVKLDDRQ